MGLVRDWLSKLGLLPGIRRSCVMVGLDGAGKTTIAQHIERKPAETDAEPLPTVGLNTKTIRQGSLTLSLFDMSGNPRHRTLWPHYLAPAHAVVFVVDATDKDRIEIARRELHLVLQDTPKACPVLILVNKMDCEELAIPPLELAGLLGMEGFRDQNWYLCGCSALTGRGLKEGFGWLLEQLECSASAAAAS